MTVRIKLISICFFLAVSNIFGADYQGLQKVYAGGEGVPYSVTGPTDSANVHIADSIDFVAAAVDSVNAKVPQNTKGMLLAPPLSADSQLDNQVHSGTWTLADDIYTVSDSSTVIDEFHIYYRHDKVAIDPDYLGNRAQLQKIQNYLANSPKIDSITIYSWASPEGGLPHNRWLSVERGKTAKQFILALDSEGRLDPSKIKLSPLVENWTGLKQKVENDYFEADREKVLRIISDNSVGEETRKWRLQRLNDGKTWDYLVKNYMRELRSATWICVWAKAIEPVDILEGPADSLLAPQPTITVPEYYSPRVPYRTGAAVKSNLLYDAFTAVNLGVEVPLGEDLSLNAHLLFPWWTAGPYGNKYAMQILALEGQMRWWFAQRQKNWYDADVVSGEYRQRDALTGHFIGIGAGTGKFDIQWGRDFGCYQCYFKEIGLSYGYSFPITRHWNMEFELTLGYMGIDYQHYIPTPDWEVLLRDNNKAGTLHYWGPTRLQIALVYPILVQRRK